MTHWNQLEEGEYGSAEEYLGIIRRTIVKRWWLIALFIVAASVAALAGSMFVEPVYRAATTITIQSNMLGSPSARRASGTPQENSLETEALWLKNRPLLEEVMDKTGIAATARSSKERLARLERLRDSINVEVMNDSLLVTVDWSEPELAAKLANALADSFIERYGAMNREEAQELRLLLEQQVNLVHVKLDEAQQAFSEFVKQHGEIAVSRQGQTSSDQIARFETELVQNNIAAANAAKRLELIRKRMGKDGEALSNLEVGVTVEQIANSRSIQALKAQVSQLEERVAALGNLYTDEYPELRNARAQLAHARRELAQEFAKLISAGSVPVDDPEKLDLLAEFIQVRSELESLKTRQSELKMLSGKLEERAKELPDKEAQYFSLLRNRTINEDLYNTLLTRLAEAKIAEETDTWNVRVIERAYAPYSRLRPKPVNNAAFGGVVGILLGLAVCMLLEYFDDSFKTAEEIERYLQVPVLAVLPKFDLPAIEYGARKQP